MYKRQGLACVCAGRYDLACVGRAAFKHLAYHSVCQRDKPYVALLRELIYDSGGAVSYTHLFSRSFKTNDSASFRYHTDKENLLQIIYMIIAGYFADDASDELTNDLSLIHI